MIRSLGALALCAWVALFAPTASPAQAINETPRITRVEDGLTAAVVIAGQTPPKMSLQDRMHYYHTTAVSIAFFDASGIRWVRAYGATPRTLFQAGSISKPVSAVGIMRLVQDGRLQLDTNVNDALKTWKVPENALTAKQPVTLRELLSHTAGMTVHGFEGYKRGTPVPTLQQVLDGVPPANSPPIRVTLQPGTQFRYSGGGYVVAERLLLDTVQEPFAKYMHDAVLEPLGMTGSTFEQPLPHDLWNGSAVATDDQGKPYPGDWRVYPEQTAAGLWTTPTDLARFAIGIQHALNGDPEAILSQATVREMLTPVRDDYGLGIELNGGGKTARFGHDGANAGFQAVFRMYRGGEGVAIMTNSDLGGFLMGEILRSIATEYGWPGYDPIQKNLYALPADAYPAFAGAYKLPGNAPTVTVFARGDELFFRYRHRNDIRLYPESSTAFFSLNQDIDIAFHVNPKNVVDGLWIIQAGDAGRAQRMTSSRQPPALVSTAPAPLPIDLPTTQFSTFMTDVLAGRIPSGLSHDTRDALTPAFVSQLDVMFARLGAFHILQFIGRGAEGKNQRFLYAAVFDKGTQALMFYTNTAGEITGLSLP
ncbi:MAG: serine hydrolase domain-containing protein [Candidatus Cybelea sp.]